MGRHALRAVTSADVAALLPPAREPGARCFTAACVAPGGNRFYLGDDEGAVVACRVVRGMENAGGELGASVRVDAVANVVDDDIVNHAPFEDSDDDDDDDDDDGRELSLRVMQLEYLPSMHALVALTPRRGVTIHHLSHHGSNASDVTIRSGRVSGTSGAVAFALDASGAHPSCVAVSRAGKNRSVTFREIVRQDDYERQNPSFGDRPRRFKPRATAVPFGRDVRLGAAHPALSLTWHADVAKLVVGNGRWYHLVDARDGACADVVPMNSMGSDRRTESLETSRRFPTTFAIVEGDGSRAVVCVTGTRAAVVSPLGEPAGKALRLGGDSPGGDSPGGAYSLAFAAPYLVAAPVRGSAPAAVFDRAVSNGEHIAEGVEPVQFLSLFDGAARDGTTHVAGEGVAGTLVACSGSLVEVYAKAPVIAQVKGMLSTPGWWEPATRLADAQREDLDHSCDERNRVALDEGAEGAEGAEEDTFSSPPPWIVAHAEAGFCAARALDFASACVHWRRAGDKIVRPVEDVARTFLPRLLPRPPEEETVSSSGVVSPEVSSLGVAASSRHEGAGSVRRRRFWNLAPPPADLDSLVSATMRAMAAGTTRAARRSVAPITGDVRTGGVITGPIAPIDPNVVHPITHPAHTRWDTANPKKDRPNESLGPEDSTGGSTFDETLLRAKRALSSYLSAHRTNAPGFELNTVCLALWAECGECDALEQTLASFANAFEVVTGEQGVKKNAKSRPYDADVVKDACRRNSRWHALAILLDTHGRRPRGERDETDAVETWRALANGEKREGGDFTFISGDGTSNVGGADLLGGAVRRLGARRVGCDFATAALVRVADDFANRRTDDEIRLFAERHLAWIADANPRNALELLTHPRIGACVPTRTALRVLDESPACGTAEPAEYLRAMMASFASGAFVRRGPSDIDAKDLQTKYALALVNAARDPNVASGAHRDHATELHNFLSSYSDGPCDAAVVARAIDPRGLTESDARGDLRGCKSLVSRDGEALGADPCTIRGFESHLVLLRRRLGDHAAAIRLILDVITHEGGVAGAEAAAEKYVERCQSGRAARRTVRLLGEIDHGIAGGESRTGTWRGDGDADVTAALLNAYVRRSTPPRWAQAARVVSNPNVRVDVDGALAMLPMHGGAEGAEGVALFERAVRRRDAANRAAEAARREAREAAEAEARSG
ncbi:predicted protein [Micromonas commoda]|uniref:Uncharacterized protein n=1 Tax=Micromonas commoda (strain RCC299 / NOUM17 / CCMP2709) TaxID=296587 RepID=C1EIU9_MICCC|nr:predicted protein [Micromonas commoda]ACO68077.1 predicted protein [Micromonas commoda]|eukprot:XP_002506819.1 predicted protein [Micromonas commoda]